MGTGKEGTWLKEIFLMQTWEGWTEGKGLLKDWPLFYSATAPLVVVLTTSD